MRFSDIRLKPKLVFLFLMTGIFPLFIVGVLGNKLASDALMAKSFNHLDTVQSIRQSQLQTFFQNRYDDLEVLGSSQNVGQALRELSHYYSEAGTFSGERFPVERSGYREIYSRYREFFLQYIRAYGYNDLFIICKDHGHVMYSVAERDAHGALLTGGAYRDSGLTELWRRVVSTENVAFVDFDRYAPGGGENSAFVGAPVFGPDGKMIGVMALQLTAEFIERIFKSQQGLGQTGESYLVRWDRERDRYELRSALKTMGDGKFVLGYVHHTVLPYWKDAFASGTYGGNGLYTDSAGKGVLVGYSSMDFLGVDWALISKIDQQEVTAPIRRMTWIIALVGCGLFLLIALGSYLFGRGITRPIIADMAFARAIAKGEFEGGLKAERKDELGQLARALDTMAVKLRKTEWLKRGKEELDDVMRGEIGTEALAKEFIAFLTRYLDGQLGAVYLASEKETEEIALSASYAFKDRSGNFSRIRIGEGLVGQAALEREILLFSDVEDQAPSLNYGVGEKKPAHFIIAPMVFEERLLGVFQVGSVRPFSPQATLFVRQNLSNISVLFNMARSRGMIETLLEKARQQQEELQTANWELEEQTDNLKTSERELQVQQEELRVTNEELEEQTRALKASEQRLQAQQEELKVTNEELEERTEALESQKASIREKNSDLVRAQEGIRQKANELEIASRYKSEFLANMSHELRTPLNSILILSQLLAGNRDGNLTDKQTESAGAIHSSGNDLLRLINEILDLSKVEAGKVELHLEEMPVVEMNRQLDRLFRGVAEENGVEFVIDVAPDVPEVLRTDSHRLQQVLRNLLANAFKFTEAGSVTLSVARPEEAEDLSDLGLSPEEAVAIAVVDEGIGIPKEKHAAIFEAFQQVDGSTSRKFGGTGLGLSISRELTKLLGGKIRLESQEGEGATFTLILPEIHGGNAADKDGEDATFSEDLHASAVAVSVALSGAAGRGGNGGVGGLSVRGDGSDNLEVPPGGAGSVKAGEKGRGSDGVDGKTNPGRRPEGVRRGKDAAKPARGKGVPDENPPAPFGSSTGLMPATDSAGNGVMDAVRDDRRSLAPGDNPLLIIEDDPRFARVLMELAQERGFKCLLAGDGETGLHFADYYTPGAIILDIGLPGIDGWEVMGRLKENPDLRHIPVHFISAEDDSMAALRMGAIGYLTKPVSMEKIDEALGRIEDTLDKPVRKLLVVEDDALQRESIRELIGNGDVVTTAVATGKEAQAELSGGAYDCMVLDLGLSDMSGFELLERMERSQDTILPPVIIYTGRELSEEEEARLRRYSESIIIKGARSPERLLDETALFLHRVESDLPEEKRRIRMNHDREAVLCGRKILLTDDDMRNVFALTSILEEKGLCVTVARNGRESLDKLAGDSEIELVLMDIMMPEMDGYEAISRIRKEREWKNLPVIALTAKAMKGDRSKCIEAGASDYLAKPVDAEKLLSMLRVWLYR